MKTLTEILLRFNKNIDIFRKAKLCVTRIGKSALIKYLAFFLLTHLKKSLKSLSTLVCGSLHIRVSFRFVLGTFSPIGKRRFPAQPVADFENHLQVLNCTRKVPAWIIFIRRFVVILSNVFIPFGFCPFFSMLDMVNSATWINRRDALPGKGEMVGAEKRAPFWVRVWPHHPPLLFGRSLKIIIEF